MDSPGELLVDSSGPVCTQMGFQISITTFHVKDTLIRPHTESFLQGVPLDLLPALHPLVGGLQFIRTVERSIEGRMNVISRTFLHGRNSSAATVSHNLRFGEMADEVLRAPQVGIVHCNTCCESRGGDEWFH